MKWGKYLVFIITLTNAILPRVKIEMTFMGLNDVNMQMSQNAIKKVLGRKSGVAMTDIDLEISSKRRRVLSDFTTLNAHFRTSDPETVGQMMVGLDQVELQEEFRIEFETVDVYGVSFSRMAETYSIVNIGREPFQTTLEETRFMGKESITSSIKPTIDPKLGMNAQRSTGADSSGTNTARIAIIVFLSFFGSCLFCACFCFACEKYNKQHGKRGMSHYDWKHSPSAKTTAI